MLDFRVKKPQSAVNWRYQEIIVTQDYIDKHHDLNLIELDYEYEMGKKVLDIYLNGQRLTEGGGYEEIDSLHVKLDIRTVGINGEMVPSILQHGDEIVIKEWFNSDSVLYGIRGLVTRISSLEVEMSEARLGFPKLKDKIMDMDRELANLLGEGDYQIDYEYKNNSHDIVKETVVGDYKIIKEYEYNDSGKPTKEIIRYGKKQTTREFVYDTVTERIVRVISNTVTI
ncbi:hypothetical protein [Brevibacillus laterosporus]|uniref:hypothetical protein n=1 Tax=Brevibacillus laterosporus TaxID=1465 RepID=UPI003D233FF6